MDTLKITLIGGPTALLEVGGLRVLTDESIAGEVIGFVISIEKGEPLVYVTGGTVWYDVVAEVAKRFPVKVVVLFAGALETAAHFQGAAIVPVDTEGWQHFKQSQEDMVNAFAALGVADRLHPLRPGIPLSLEI